MKKLLSIIALLAVLYISPVLTSAVEITISPNEPTVGNCFPFGQGAINDSSWPPFAGFIYKNIPPFSLKPGDILAFDLGEVASADVHLDIELAATTSNGGTDPVLPFTKVVSNTQTPLNPRGDDIVGDFEMQFTVVEPFDFPGGGLIIRFSNPSLAYQLSNSCDQVLVRATSADSSGFFVRRFFRVGDGLPPYNVLGGNTEPSDLVESIGGFRVVTGVRNVPTLSEWGMIAAAAGLGLTGILFASRRRREAGRV